MKEKTEREKMLNNQLSLATDRELTTITGKRTSVDLCC